MVALFYKNNRESRNAFPGFCCILFYFALIEARGAKN